MAEIDSGGFLQASEHQVMFIAKSGRRRGAGEAGRDFGEFWGDAVGRQDEINASGFDSATLRARRGGRWGLGGDGNASLGLNRSAALNSVQAVAGEDDGDGLVLAIRRERAKKMIEGTDAVRRASGTRWVKDAAGDGKERLRGSDIDMVRPEVRGFAEFFNGNGCFGGEIVRKGMRMAGAGVRQQNEGHAGLDWELGEQLGEGRDAGFRESQAHYRESCLRHGHN